MVLLAELLADLTSLKTISSIDALGLVSTDRNYQVTIPDDDDLDRSTKFLKLQCEQKKRKGLMIKRRDVDLVAERLATNLRNGFSEPIR